LQPPPLEFRKFHVMTTEIGREPLEIGGPARRISDRVEQNLDLGHARLYVEAVAHLDHLGVHGGARIADRLGIPLPELAISARLRAVVAEHRPDHAQLHRLGPGVHSVLNKSPNDARRGLRAESPRFRLLRSRRQPEELLLDDVGDFADPPLEHGRLLEHRRLHLEVAVAAGQRPSEAFESIQTGADIGKEVACTPGSAKRRHGESLATTKCAQHRAPPPVRSNRSFAVGRIRPRPAP
jgi:hypothetical protein